MSVGRRLCSNGQKDYAAKFNNLGTFIELVRLAELVEDVVESVEQGNPMVKVSSRKGPLGWKYGKLLR